MKTESKLIVGLAHKIGLPRSSIHLETMLVIAAIIPLVQNTVCDMICLFPSSRMGIDGRITRQHGGETNWSISCIEQMQAKGFMQSWHSAGNG